MKNNNSDLFAFKQMLFEIISGSAETSSLVQIYSFLHKCSLEESRKRLRKEVMEFLEQRYRIKRRYGNFADSFDRFLRDDVTVVETMVWLLGPFFSRGQDINTLIEK